jgi:hypothetical protein
MTEPRTAHTAELDVGVRSAIRDLIDAASGAVSDDTFENVLGGELTCDWRRGVLW